MGDVFDYLVPGRPDFSRVRVGDVANGNYTAVETDGTIVHKGNSTVWEDQRYALIGQRLDSPAGAIDYNLDEIAVDFAANADYPDDFVAISAQISHQRKSESDIRPHFHWDQTSDGFPNILIAYRWYNNGELIPSTWELVALDDSSNAFTYTSGTLLQISSIPLPAGLGEGKALSSFFDIKIYRDTANASTLFAGADSYTGIWRLREFDIHIEIDTDGSRQEFIK